MSRSTIVFSLALTQFSALALLALSAHARDREPNSVTRLQNRQDSSAQFIGTLSCRNEEVNAGEACKLLFKTTDTGRILELAGNKNSAMRMYLDGTRNVAIEGPITGAYLRIEKINALN